MAHDPLASMLDMLLGIKRIEKFVDGVSREEFLTDELLQAAVFGQSVVIGKAANRVQKEVQELYPEIEWAKIVAFRNRLIHGYDSVDWELVFEIIHQTMPACRIELEKVVPPEEDYKY
jgi:uncharacterized protein with HEPN domain